MMDETIRRLLREHQHVASPALSAFEQMQRQLDPVRRVLEQFEADRVAALSPLLEEMQRSEDAIRLALGPLEEMRRAAALAHQSPLAAEFERLQNQVAEYEARFRLPGTVEAQQLLRQWQELEGPVGLARYHSDTASLASAMQAMDSPWLKATDGLRSMRDFGELQAIGHAVSDLAGFDPTLTDLLRHGLGDWRDEIGRWPDEIATDPYFRAAFYAERGFNPGLTDLPAPAFRQSLKIAGLSLDDMTIDVEVEVDVVEIDPDDDVEGFERTNQAHRFLLLLEIELRRFIESRMREAAGTTWIKQRVPGDVRQGWEDRKAEAAKHGEPDRPLIEYADFTDYIKIIARTDNWNEVFAPVFRRKESVTESFQRLHPIRLATMHARLITQDDLLMLCVEAKRIRKALNGE